MNVRSVEIDSFPHSRVRNSQAHGIGRVAALNGLGAWSNLGRNVVFVGRNNGELQAYDAASGDQLWSFQTGAGANSTPTFFQQDRHVITDYNNRKVRRLVGSNQCGRI